MSCRVQYSTSRRAESEVDVAGNIVSIELSFPMNVVFLFKIGILSIK